jgi:hypothetical protein
MSGVSGVQDDLAMGQDVSGVAEVSLSPGKCSPHLMPFSRHIASSSGLNLRIVLRATVAMITKHREMITKTS